MTPIRAALIFWVMSIVFLGGLGVFSLYEIISVANLEMFLPPTNTLLQKLIIIVCLTAVLISVQLALIFWAVCTQTHPQPEALSKQEHPDRTLMDLNVLTDYVTGTLAGDFLLSAVIIVGGTAAFLDSLALSEVIGGLLVICGAVLLVQPLRRQPLRRKQPSDAKNQ